MSLRAGRARHGAGKGLRLAPEPARRRLFHRPINPIQRSPK